MKEPAISKDDHRHGMLANSPIALVFVLAICATAYGIYSLLQITSTEQDVFGLLQLNVQLQPVMTGSQVAQAMDGSLGHNQTIASAIGWAVQIALLMLSFPPEHAIGMLNLKYNNLSSASLAKHADKLSKLRKFMMYVLIGGDVVTDFYFVIQNHNLFSWDGWHPSLGSNAGVFLVGLLYPVAICFVTVFVGKYMFAYLDALLDVLRDAYAKPATTSKSASVATK